MATLIVRQRDGANETFNLIGERFTVLASGEETGSYEAFIQVVPPGAGPPLHSHPWDEAFYVLEGELVFRTDAKETRAPSGTFVHFPSGTPHAFSSPTGTSTILSFTSRPGAGAFFRELNRVVAESPGDRARLLAVAPKHEIRLFRD